MRITGDPYMSSYSTIRTRSSRVSMFSFCSIHSTDAAWKVAIGDRIAQLILEKIETPPVLEVDVSGDNRLRSVCILTLVQDLEETLRGAGGFGSTGV